MKHDILGQVIKESRMNKGISQEKLTELLDCSPRHIIGIENEHKKPGYELLYRLIRTLNISADTIFYPEHSDSRNEKDNLISLISLIKNCDKNTVKILSAVAHAILNTK